MMEELVELHDAQVLSALDLQFAQTLERLVPHQSAAVLLGAAFASRAVSQGHVCADLRRLVGRPLLNAGGEPVHASLPSIFEWVMELGASALCGNGEAATPLVFDGEARLYLRRYWQYQNEVAEDLRQRAMATMDTLDEDALGDLRTRMERLFRAQGNRSADVRQQLAALSAARHRLAVISGGPGTGKTTTVVRVLALLVEQALARGDAPPRIELLAPTGKAAARLLESVNAGRATLDCTEVVRAAIPYETATIHRRLGVRMGHPTQFFHNRDHPLPADIILVDEASMVDLALMAKLLHAVPRSARLILLGDKDQLASVEAGAILGDICNVDGDRGYSTAFAGDIEHVFGTRALETIPVTRSSAGIWDCVVELTHSFRFQGDGGIGQLANAINRGNGESAVAQVQTDADPHLRLVPLLRPQELAKKLAPLVVPAFRPILAAKDPRERLERLSEFRLLAAHRRGRFGTEHLNRLIETLLRSHGLVRGSSHLEGVYDGRPILVTQNDYQLELFNGDVGILHRDGPKEEIRAYFLGAKGELRSFLPGRLPPHESVYAMTVHKSQGSEFREVGVLMPPQLSPLMTRELIYTAVTRARERVTLLGSADVLREAIERRIDRASGLRDALWRSR